MSTVVLLLLSVVTPGKGNRAESIEKPLEEFRLPTAKHVSAPVYYKDAILILTSKEGVAAVQFIKPFDETERIGIRYRYRFLEKGAAKAVNGHGEVFERKRGQPVELLPPGTPAGPQSASGNNVVHAGDLEIVWSASNTQKGWVYYLPEKMRVQIANGVAKSTPMLFPRPGQPEELKKVDRLHELDLKRFEW